MPYTIKRADMSIGKCNETNRKEGRSDCWKQSESIQFNSRTPKTVKAGTFYNKPNATKLLESE